MLFLKGRIWTFRIRVPSDVRPYVKRDYIQKSLGTESKTDAETLKAIAVGKLHEKWQAIRTSKTPGTLVARNYDSINIDVTGTLEATATLLVSLIREGKMTEKAARESFSETHGALLDTWMTTPSDDPNPHPEDVVLAPEEEAAIHQGYDRITTGGMQAHGGQRRAAPD
jgi:hypothetical protein